MAARNRHGKKEVVHLPGHHYPVWNGIDSRRMAEKTVEVYTSRFAFAHCMGVEGIMACSDRRGMNWRTASVPDRQSIVSRAEVGSFEAPAFAYISLSGKTSVIRVFVTCQSPLAACFADMHGKGFVVLGQPSYP